MLMTLFLDSNMTRKLQHTTIVHDDDDGVDFTGALHIREVGAQRKVHICLFTCAATRAVHLEVVKDLSVQTFLLPYR